MCERFVARSVCTLTIQKKLLFGFELRRCVDSYLYASFTNVFSYHLILKSRRAQKIHIYRFLFSKYLSIVAYINSSKIISPIC